jgi:hypothetical protein
MLRNDTVSVLMSRLPSAAVIALLLVGTAAMAADPAPPANQKLNAVLGCRAIADPGQRLACFDKNVDALQAANANREIVVVDRGEVRKARRSLFGFNLPSLNIFGGEPDKDKRKPDGIEGEDDEISAVIASARRDADGYWIVVLADGAVWHQTGGMIAVAPRAGGTVTIRRAALGSYFLRIGKQPGVKARRDS